MIMIFDDEDDDDNDDDDDADEEDGGYVFLFNYFLSRASVPNERLQGDQH